jgi:hypothetical protein
LTSWTVETQKASGSGSRPNREPRKEVLRTLQGLESAVSADFVLDASRMLELASKAYFLYFKRTPAERAKLLKLAARGSRVMLNWQAVLRT